MADTVPASELASYIGKERPPSDWLMIDQDRIDACCVHILDPEGNPVSFCEYNAVNRPRMGAA